MRYFILLTVLLALVSCDNEHHSLDMVMNEIVDDETPRSIDAPDDENVVVIPIPKPLIDPITGLPSNPTPTVIVIPDPESQPEPIGKNDRIIVINTLNDGLRIRDAPGGIRIGGMFDGETGTIISDPKMADGLVWFKIEWDRPVKDHRSGCGDRDVCVGWSVEVTGDGTEVLDLLR